jgi:hypothetical protein
MVDEKAESAGFVQLSFGLFSSYRKKKNVKKSLGLVPFSKPGDLI